MRFDRIFKKLLGQRASRRASTNNPGIRQVTTPVGDPAWLVTGYSDIKALLTDPRMGTSHPTPARAARYCDSTMFGGPSGDSRAVELSQHAWLRCALVPAFSTQRLDAMRPRVRAIVESRLDEMEKMARPVDFHEAVSVPLPLQVICDLLGVSYADRADILRWAEDAGVMNDRARSQAGLAHLRDYMRGIVDRKHQQPADDPISDLIAAWQRAPDVVSYEDVVSHAAELLFAGFSTLPPVIDRGIVLLLTNPRVRQEVQANMLLIPPAVEEILRLPWPARQPANDQGGVAIRYAHEPIEIGGVTIYAGDLVLLGLEAGNCDARVFPNPELFDLARTKNHHLAFGHGVHYCLGAPLARIELQMLYEALLRRFPTLRLAVAAEELHSHSHLVIGGLTALPVTW